MRVGADGSWMRWSQTGIGRYSDGLLTALATRLGGTDELVVYYNSTSGPRLVPGARERFVRTPNRTLWNQVRLPLALAADRCDVHLGTAIVTPLATRVPCVPVVYDCLSFEDPSAKSGRDGRYWRRWTAAAVQRAPRVVVISRYVADQCARHLGVDPSRVLVAYPAPDPRFRPAGDDERRAARARLDAAGVPGRYVLHVGAGDRHKGAAVLADAVASVRARGDELTVVRCGAGVASGDGAVGVGLVEDATLVDLYRCAAAVAVTSSHEGFGLPVVEALACGTPVVASRAAALPEAGGDAAVYAQPGDVAGVSAALRTVLDEDAAAAARRRAAGLAQAQRFRWDHAAATVEGALHAAMTEGRLRPAGARR